MNGYIKVSEASMRWEIGERRIVILCNQGRISGTVKFGNTWIIPDRTEKPKDERIKTGRYKGVSRNRGETCCDSKSLSTFNE